MKRRYDLTVYLSDDECHCAIPIYSGVFYSIDKLVRFCCQFEQPDMYPFKGQFSLLFDVFDSVRGQFNINDLVERFKI